MCNRGCTDCAILMKPPPFREKKRPRVLACQLSKQTPQAVKPKAPTLLTRCTPTRLISPATPHFLSLRLSLREFDSNRRRRDEGHGDDRRRADSLPRRRPRRIRKLARPVLPPPQSICSRLAGFAEFGDESATRAGNDLEFWKG